MAPHLLIKPCRSARWLPAQKPAKKKVDENEPDESASQTRRYQTPRSAPHPRALLQAHERRSEPEEPEIRGGKDPRPQNLRRERHLRLCEMSFLIALPRRRARNLSSDPDVPGPGAPRPSPTPRKERSSWIDRLSLLGSNSGHRRLMGSGAACSFSPQRAVR